MREGRAIQTHLSLNKRAFIEKDAVARTFAKLMMAGNVKTALRYLSDNHDVGLLSLDEQSAEGMTVCQALKAKHPAPGEVKVDAQLPQDSSGTNSTHPVIFERITGILSEQRLFVLKDQQVLRALTRPAGVAS